MVNASNRKAVYVPGVLWQKLDADAKSNLDTVTTVLKNVLLTHYNMANIGNNKSLTSTAVPSETTGSSVSDF